MQHLGPQASLCHGMLVGKSEAVVMFGCAQSSMGAISLAWFKGDIQSSFGVTCTNLGCLDCCKEKQWCSLLLLLMVKGPGLYSIGVSWEIKLSEQI